ncbi:hypothetical protein [Corynebacterium variabile]|uniref:hypothetical protein n=1 Tax=Corynebacterium variabile TaxID=1727 RepID=UPI0028AC357C|nr:hypothetical protein [Corynebacterium variabile]
MVEQSRRVLPVRVDTWTVMDMNGPECDLGETVEFILEFREASEESEEGADRADMTVTVDAWAQEYPGAGEFDPEQMTWTTLLTGDGWSARWDAPRPVLGRVRLTGTFHRESLGPHETTVALPMRISDAEMYLARVQGPTADPEEDACRVVTVDRNSGRRYFTVFGDGSSVEDAEKAAAPGRTEAGRIVIRYEETDSRMYTPPGGIYGWPVSSGVQHLGRADANGDVTWIREWEVGESDTTASLLTVGGQVMLWRRGAVQYLDDELEVVREARLPDGIPPEAGYSPEVSGDVLVVSGDRMLAVLDPADLSVILQVQVDARAHAQVDDNATIWVADDRLRLFTKDAAGEWTVREVEVG